jgi:hypothetical protein
MSKYNRRERPNLRHVCEFWIPSTVPNAAGEMQQKFDLHYKAAFSLEVPTKPIEITDAGRIQSEQIFLLIGQWCKIASQITAGMFCAVPSMSKVYAVLGPATDPRGDRRKLHIRIVDNVSQHLTVELLPTMY